MSKRDGGVNRQRSVESGLTQAFGPMLICASDSSVSVRNQQGSDQLSLPQTTESRMAKMKKMISPHLKRRNLSDGVTVVGNKTFGVSVDDLLRKSDGCKIPPVITTIVEYLEEHALSIEGIFRISGNHKVVESLKSAFDKDGEIDFEQVGDVMAVAGLLKLFLRELPNPLIPQNLTAEFIKVHKAHKDGNGSLSEIKSLLEKLPPSSYDLLKYLCKFLVKVSNNEEINKMSSMALAIVFGPNFFRCKDGIEGLREQGHTNAIVCEFIQEFDSLFEVSPYATTEIFRIQEAKSNDSMALLARNKYLEKVVNEKPESSASDWESSRFVSDRDKTDLKDDGPTYATVIKKPKKSLQPSEHVSSSTEDSGMYVRSVSPSWNTQHSDSSPTQESPKAPGGKEIVQKVINDTIKEHLFGPDLMSTDENSPHSPESGDEGPPLPSRNYGEEETVKQKRRRRRNNKNQKQIPGTIAKVEGNERETKVMNTVEFLETELQVKARQRDKEQITKTVKKRPKSEGYELFEKETYVIGLDNNSNNILSSTFPGDKKKAIQHKQDEIVMGNEGLYEEVVIANNAKDALSMVKRNSEILGSLTQGRAPPPKNRRRPSLKKRHDTSEIFTNEQDSDKAKQSKPSVHPLVDEAKSKDIVRTTPPKSPRSGRSTRMQQPSVTLPRQEAWKSAEVIPNRKSGDPGEPENTRPISLLPIMSKVCERAAHSQFMDFLEKNGEISGLQSGNRKLHSTETALVHYTDQLLKNMDEKRISLVVLLDMSKAFDSIRHDKLLSKLQSLGVSDSALAWFKSYISSRKQVVRIGSALSDPLPLTVGVAQGSILGPVLFTLYVNDLLSVPKKCEAMGYVDDTKLLLALPPSDTKVAISDLNSDLREVAKWCSTNSLLINPEKTKLLIVGVPQLTRNLSLPPVVLLGKNIKPSTVVKYLGVWVDTAVTFDDHIFKLSSSCLYKLRRINRIKHLLDSKTLKLIINALIFSRLFYCSNVWGNTSSKNICKLQLIQNFACRIILGLKKFDHVSVARKSLGWLGVRQKLRLNTVTMVHKCRTNQAPPYMCNLFHDRFSVSGRSTRNKSQLNLPKCRLSTGQRSFAFRGAKEYNLLPEYIRATNNILSFKRKAAAHFFKNIS